jgi:hypothetical protein
MPRTTRRTITVEVDFIGPGRIVESPSGVFKGGVPEPVLGQTFRFNVLPEVAKRDGSIGPRPDAKGYSGSLQINLAGTASDYRELGRHLLAIAELDASADPDFHQHYDGLRSMDGRTQINLILRKVLV